MSQLTTILKKLSEQHDWIPSTYGHGNFMCTKCLMTDLEARALNCYEVCPKNCPKKISGS